MQNSDGLHSGGVLAKPRKNVVPHGRGTTLFCGWFGASVVTHERQRGFQRALPLAHDFRRKSSALCLPPGWREKLRRRLMGGAVLSGRKTGRDFRADSEIITFRFRLGGRHTALVLA